MNLRVNFQNSFINNPVKAIHKPSFRKMQIRLMKHASIHYFLHNLYCRLNFAWKAIPYAQFVLRKLAYDYGHSTYTDST